MTRRATGRWLPLLLSAAAWPGSGQFMQKRPLWGTAYAIGFTLSSGLFFVLLFPVLLRMFDAWTGGPAPEPVDWKTILRPLALALAIYVTNLVDVWWGMRKASRPPPLPRPG